MATEPEAMPIPPAYHLGVHDYCTICDAILHKRRADMQRGDAVDANELLDRLDSPGDAA